jgi:hypothetical protein
MSTTPNFSSTVRTAVGQVSTANTARNGTGTIATIFTAGSSGSRIETIDICAIATTTAGMVRLFLHDGTTSWLYREQPIPANSVSAAYPAFQVTLTFGDMVPLVLASGWSLRASTEKAETFNITVFGGDF